MNLIDYDNWETVQPPEPIREALKIKPLVRPHGLPQKVKDEYKYVEGWSDQHIWLQVTTLEFYGFRSGDESN